jgi:hypothetical protein
MGSPLLHVGATVLCPHGSQATIVASNARVMVGGQPVAVQSDTTTVAGCPFQVPAGPSTKPQPCVTVKWLVPATRITIGGQPALLQSSSSLCQSAEQIPQGPANVAMTQIRVTGQ